MKKIVFGLALGLLSIGTQAQDNVTKLRYSPVPAFGDEQSKGFMNLFNGTISLSQERKISDRLSIQATLRYLPTKSDGILDSITTVTYDEDDYNPFVEPTFGGIGGFLDLKIYKEEALHGFYWGPYLHTMQYKLQSERDYLEAYDDNGILYYGEAQTRYKMSNMGLGLQIGSQKIWDSGFTIDWNIGVGINGVKAIGEVDVEKTSNNFDFRNYEDEINEDASFFIENPDITVEKESVTFKTDRYFTMSQIDSDLPGIPFLNFRFGISFGFGY